MGYQKLEAVELRRPQKLRRAQFNANSEIRTAKLLLILSTSGRNFHMNDSDYTCGITYRYAAPALTLLTSPTPTRRKEGRMESIAFSVSYGNAPCYYVLLRNAVTSSNWKQTPPPPPG